MKLINKRIHLFYLFAISLWLGSTLFVLARSGGITGRTDLSDTPGCTCHNASPSQNVQVRIDGPDTMEINATATYKVIISGGPAAAAGTNIAVNGGSLAPQNSALQLLNGELTHKSPVNFDQNQQVVFEFQFTAPAEPTAITMAANGNSVNLNGSNSGDEWNFAPDKIITVESPSALDHLALQGPEHFILENNYPNPFGKNSRLSLDNPSTTIRYSLKTTGRVQLTIYNALGQQVKRLVNRTQSPGAHQIRFNASHLPSGFYFYRLTVNGQSRTKRMQLIR